MDLKKIQGFAKANEEYVNSYEWEAVGNMSGVNTALTAANLAAATAEALSNVVAYQPSFGQVAAEFRFYTDDASNNETYIMNVYGRVESDDYYTYIGKLTLTIGLGQRASASILWADGVSLDATDKWLTTLKVTAPANGTIGKFLMNLHGYRSVLFMGETGVMTAADADTMYIEARRF